MIIHVPTQIKVELSKAELEDIVNRHLNELMGEYFVRDGKLMTEYHTSHRFDGVVDDREISKAHRRTLMAIAELRDALKEWPVKC
jgi:hypothetical protein